MKKLGIALGGGGAKGLCHLAFLKALEEIDIQPAIISGTSIGAIIGGCYAAGLTADEIIKIVDDLNFNEIRRMLDISLRSPSAFLKGKGVESFLQKILPVCSFEELKIPLKIVASSFWDRKEILFDSGDLVLAIRASMSLPGIFEPVRLDHKILVDGGLVNPLPVDVIRKQCDILAAVDVSGEKTFEGNKIKPGFFETLVTSVQIAEATIVEEKIKTHQPDILIKPKLTNVRVLDFDRSDEIIESVSDDVIFFKRKISEHMSQRNFFHRLYNRIRYAY